MTAAGYNPIHVDHGDAVTVIERAWLDAENASLVPSPRLKEFIERVMRAQRAKGFRYALITGILAKNVNPAVHPRALQAQSSLKGAYDARSLCHKVVVSFEKTRGNLFGLSNEPFVSKALRHPEHDKDNPQLRNKKAARDLHEALELVRTASNEEAYSALVHILRLGKANAATMKSAEVASEHNLAMCEEFVRRFLQRAEGGARLVALWGAFLSLGNPETEVSVYGPNQSDEYSGTLGDVEVFLNGVLVSASECKHRPLNKDDVEHGLRKNVVGAEYVFVIAAGLQSGQEDAIRKRIASAAQALDVSLVEAQKDFPTLLKFLGAHRRKKLGSCVVDLLREMKEFQPANEAALLWNELLKEQSV